MNEYPNCDDVLQGVQGFLNQNVIPSISDRGLRFRIRVAAHLIATVRRELELGPTHRAKERRRLLEMNIRPEGDQGDDAGLASPSLNDLNGALAKSIRDGGNKPELDDIKEHLFATLREALSVIQPDFDCRFECESPSPMNGDP